MSAPRPALSPEAILDQAIELIRTRGVEALSMRALASALGVTAPALYAHFESRDEILRACAQVGYDRLEDRFAAAHPSSAIEMVWASSRSYLRFALEEPELFAVMFMFRPDSIKVDVDRDIEHIGASTVFDAMITNLATAMDEGALRPDDPLAHGLALWAAVHGVATVAGMAPGLDVDRLLDDVVGAMVAGWSRAD